MILRPKRRIAGSSSLLCSVFALFLCVGASVTHAGGEVVVEADAQKETGVATYYGQRFEGRRTASGQTFRHSELMAAHAFYPFGTLVRVTNLRNGSFVDVKIADRGGFAKRSSNLIIDLSRSAAERLDMLSGGRARVLVEVLKRRDGRDKVNVAASDSSLGPSGGD